MADTTTTLNPGTGGDVMDESQVTQTDGVTQAKRPRVVIGGDRGAIGGVSDTAQPVNADPGASPMSIPVVPVAVVDDTPQSYVTAELRPFSMTPEGRVRVSTAAANIYLDMFGDTSTIGTDPNESIHFFNENNPWGF